MRILIAAGIYPPDAGGPAVHAKAQFEGFPKIGIETDLVTLAHYRHWPVGIRHFLYFAQLIFKAAKYDIIYAHDAVGAGIPALVAARIFNKKFVVRIGGDIAWEYKAGKVDLSLKEWYASGDYRNDIMFLLSRWLMRHADLIVLPSPLLVDLYTHFYGIKKSKIKLIPNPFPEIIAKSAKIEKTIIWASRLTAYKNLPIVIKALAEILPDNKDLKFIIMGDGPEKEKLENLVRSTGIQANVIFTGSVSFSEVLERTSTSLFAVAPALTEFNPNYVLQGISFGKPFLISREHGLPFDVPENMLFNPRNEVELKNRILYLLSPVGYAQALEEIRKINTVKSWNDNLRENKEFIASLIKDKI